MKTLPVGEFKTHLSEILENIKNGEEVAISFGKKKKKIAVLVPYSKYAKNNKRKLGLLEKKASFSFSDNFKITDDDFLNS
ncbi:MAG: type II toxin-antitoxin system Phd/YefM family antitoxin [Spirochaetes bacterium]|nr:type II toxin-antitoxin system Phd/YefM family antitoxin [Spirochaetota bacterium]